MGPVRSAAEGNPNKDVTANRFIREPGHIEFAGGLGLGVYDKSKIELKSVKI